NQARLHRANPVGDTSVAPLPRARPGGVAGHSVAGYGPKGAVATAPPPDPPLSTASPPTFRAPTSRVGHDRPIPPPRRCITPGVDPTARPHPPCHAPGPLSLRRGSPSSDRESKRHNAGDPRALRGPCRQLDHAEDRRLGIGSAIVADYGARRPYHGRPLPLIVWLVPPWAFSSLDRIHALDLRESLLRQALAQSPWVAQLRRGGRPVRRFADLMLQGLEQEAVAAGAFVALDPV